MAWLSHRRGVQAEQWARRYLMDRSMQILQQNYRCRFGELDVVGLLGEVLVFVEVKARSRRQYGTAMEQLTRVKKQRLKRAAQHFLMRYPEHAERYMRFDVLAMQRDNGGVWQTEWVQDAWC